MKFIIKGFIFLFFIIGYDLTQAQVFDKLQCTITSSDLCTAGNISVCRLSSATNAHAERPQHFTMIGSIYLNHIICCGGVVGLNTKCGDTHQVFLNLSSSSNAHVEQNIYQNYAYPLCLSVPEGGRVNIAYQMNNCEGYHTTLASMTSTTNAHLGGPNDYPLKICASAWGTGELTALIIDDNDEIIEQPIIDFSTQVFSFFPQTSMGMLGNNSQKIRLVNSTFNEQWSLSIAAEDGPNSVWSDGINSYAYNDASDHGYHGQMFINPQISAIVPKDDCNNTGLNKGNAYTFNQGIVDSITLLNTNSSAQTHCYWDLTNIQINQIVPAEQAEGDYQFKLMLSLIAY